MGIHNFHSWLHTTYRSCYRPHTSRTVFDYVHIDINHLLHSALNGSSTKDYFLERLKQALNQIICNYTATKKLILAVDGTSPYAKILLQRKRRLQGVHKLQFKNKNKIHALDLTPGTQLMKDVDEFLTNYANSINTSFKYLKTTAEYHSSATPLEGEVKIFQRINQIAKQDNNPSHLIIGNDADLVLLAMSTTTTDNMHLLIRSQKKINILSLKKLINRYQVRFKLSVFNTTSHRLDFSAVTMFFGNDYLPKLTAVKFDKLWLTYHETKKLTNLTLINSDNDTFTYNLEFLKVFCRRLIFTLLPRYRILEPSYNASKVRNYLEGVLWCLHMYNKGECSMVDWTFRYTTAPTPTELLFFLDTNNTPVNVPVSTTRFIDNDVYPLMVMPMKAKHLVPEKYHNLMNNELKDLYDLENCPDCNNIKSRLSQSYKMFSQTADEKYKEQISSTSSQLSKHRKTHQERFDCEDVKHIVKCVNKLL